jgi:hypothetical protein
MQEEAFNGDLEKEATRFEKQVGCRRCAVAEREDRKVCRWCIRAEKAEGPEEEGGGGGQWMEVPGSCCRGKPEAQSEADAAVQWARSQHPSSSAIDPFPSKISCPLTGPLAWPIIRWPHAVIGTRLFLDLPRGKSFQLAHYSF